MTFIFYPACTLFLTSLLHCIFTLSTTVRSSFHLFPSHSHLYFVLLLLTLILYSAYHYLYGLWSTCFPITLQISVICKHHNPCRLLPDLNCQYMPIATANKKGHRADPWSFVTPTACITTVSLSSYMSCTTHTLLWPSWLPQYHSSSLDAVSLDPQRHSEAPDLYTSQWLLLITFKSNHSSHL